ncbi:MAG: glycosyltransferase [Candidatus Lokiarchaeota archaeon]|nr:glycosyltransferase [Candidatus Lokiarchaeota archaeon]
MFKSNKLTFLMPTFNDEKYIQASIDSIINQTFSNWELLIMDKSTDKTLEIIKSYASKLPNKIKYFKQEDIGQLNALLGLIPHITGNYIMLIHSDDFLVHNNIIRIIMEEIVSSDADGLYSDLILVDKDGFEKGQNKSFFSLKKLIISGGSNCIPDHFFLKKEIFEKYVIPNYLIRNIPYYFRINEGKFELPNLQYSKNSWYSYRIYEENLALSNLGFFILINGQIRLIKDFFSQQFIISPYKFTFNKILNKILNISFQKLPNLTENILKIKKSSLKNSLNQFKGILSIKRQQIAKSEIEGKSIILSYIENVINSIDDFIEWKEKKNNKNKLLLDENFFSKFPIFKGKDVRLFYSEFLNKKENDNLNLLFSKEYNLLLCENNKIKEKIEQIMDFFNYLTPVILK